MSHSSFVVPWQWGFFGLMRGKDPSSGQQALTSICACLVPQVWKANSSSGITIINGDAFLDFLKMIRHKFPRCYLFLDKASPHYRSRKVGEYFDRHKDTLIPVYLPTASPEFMVMEEVWNIAKRDLLVLKCYPSFSDFKKSISCYFRTKRFNLNMRNYLLREV